MAFRNTKYFLEKVVVTQDSSLHRVAKPRKITIKYRFQDYWNKLKMLGEPILEKLMRLHLKSQQQYGFAPFAYLPGEDKMKTLDIGGTRRIFESTLNLLIITGLWLQMYGVDKATVGTVQQLECAFWASLFSELYLTKWSVTQHSAAVVELYNLFVSFEQSCLRGKSIHYILSVFWLFDSISIHFYDFKVYMAAIVNWSTKWRNVSSSFFSCLE